MKAKRLGHVGVTVSDLNLAIDFWASFIGNPPVWKRTASSRYLSEITGYEDVSIDVCLFEVCQGLRLELLEYGVVAKAKNDMATANPGNVHVCLEVEDIEESWELAVSLGAMPVSSGPVAITDGPNEGSTACYLRIHDDVTLELVQL